MELFPSGDGGNDGNPVSGFQRGCSPLEESDILFVHVDINEAADVLPLTEPFFQSFVTPLQVLDQLPDRAPFCVNFGLAVGLCSEGCRNPDEDAHAVLPPLSTTGVRSSGHDIGPEIRPFGDHRVKRFYRWLFGRWR